MGKTRIAIEVAHRRLAAGRSVEFCDLRNVDRSEDLAAELGRVLHVDFKEGWGLRHQVECIGRALVGRGACIVLLDNFDRLSSDAPDTLGHWLRLAPNVTFFVTTRSVLRLPEETIYELGPLTLPKANEDPEVRDESDAVRLLQDRAAAIDPGFGAALRESSTIAADPNLELRSSVEDLVRRLEGIPLAIELAAAQLRQSTMRDLLLALDAEFVDHERAPQLPSRGPYTVLFQAIERSWSGLDAAERSTLAQLTAFRGGFTRDAACAVVDLDHIPGAPSVAETLARLRDASLLRVRERSDPAGALRFDLFEAIREFAAEKLQSGRAASLRARHGAFYLGYGERWCGSIASPRGPQARAVLRTEFDNLRAATSWWTQQQDPPDGAKAGRMALVFFEAVHRWNPGVALGPLTRVLALSTESALGSTEVRARLLVARACVFRDTDDRTAASADLAMAATLPALSASVQAEITCETARLLWARGEHAEARPLLERVLDVACALPDVRLEARARMLLARVLAEVYLDPAAFDHHARATAILYELGDVCEATLARKTWCVHRIFFQRGDAGKELEDQLALLREFRESLDEAQGLTGLGIYHEERGGLDQARRCFDRARELGERSGMRLVQGHAYMRLANCLDEQGQSAAARLAYARAIRVFESVDDQRNIALNRIFLAGLAAREGDPETASMHLEAARELLAPLAATGFEAVADLQTAQIDLARSRRSLDEGAVSEAEALRQAARERLNAAQTARASGASNVVRLPLLHCSPEARFVARIVERELGRPVRQERCVRVWRDGLGFQLGEEPPTWVRGHVTRRVLAALAEERLANPGAVLPVERLLARGWPNERMLPEAGLARVREVVKRLRRAGLRRYLLTGEAGYLLNPEVSIQIVNSSTPDAIADRTGDARPIGTTESGT